MRALRLALGTSRCWSDVRVLPQRHPITREVKTRCPAALCSPQRRLSAVRRWRNMVCKVPGFAPVLGHVIDQAIPSALVILNCWCNHMIGQQLAFCENICISVVFPIINYMTVIFSCMGNTNVAMRTKKGSLASCSKLRSVTPHHHSPPFSSVLTAPMLLEDGAIINSRKCTDQSVLHFNWCEVCATTFDHVSCHGVTRLCGGGQRWWLNGLP